MRVREFLQPAAVLGEGDTLATALPWLQLDNPVFVRASGAWRMLLPRDVVGFPESRILADCPTQPVVPVSPDDDIDILLEPAHHDVVPAQERGELVGQVDRRELLEEMRILEVGNPLVAPALLLSRAAPPLIHDLANALTALRGALPEPDASSEAGVAATALDHAMRLVVYFGRIVAAGDEPAPAPLDLQETIESVLELLRAVVGPGIVVALVAAPGLPRVRVARRLVERVLLNLVLNARDAMHGEGTISIELRPGREPSHVVVIVADDGPGVPSALADRIFLPGVTSKAGGGRGLGLAGIARALHRVGGRISLDDSAGPACTRMRVQLRV